MKIFTFISVLLLSATSYAQQLEETEFKFLGTDIDRVVVPFQLINNLIIIDAQINGSVPMKFILDTGVANTIVTSLPPNAEITLESSRQVRLAGLGEDEPVTAFYSEKNRLNIGGIQGDNIAIAFLTEDIFQLSSYMGTYIHGIIGYDLLSDFAVEINYQRKHMIFYDLDAYEDKFEHLEGHRRWTKVPIELVDKKPYVKMAFQHSPDDEYQQVRLLLDSGASSAFSLYEVTHPEIKVPKSHVKSLIGVGLNGKVKGSMGRINKMEFDPFSFKEPVVSYPDSFSIRQALILDNRNGSVGGEVLRRFKQIYNYRDGYLLLRKNGNYNEKFYYNKSGIEVYTPYPELPLYVISEVRKGSPADIRGIEPGDIIKNINGNSTARMKLNDVIGKIQKSGGNQLRLRVQRDTNYYTYILRVPDVLIVDGKS